MRIAVPEFGPFPMIFVRIGGAALVLLPLFLQKENRRVLIEEKKPLFVLGLFNSALPFCFFGLAAVTLEAGFTSLLNATTPICTAIIGLCWLRLPLTRFQVLGLLIGFAGIAILTGNRLDFSAGQDGWPILAVLAATFCYGFSGHYAKLKLSHLTPLVVSAGSLLFSTLVLLPFALAFLPDSVPSPKALACGLALALVCTAFAFVLFFDVLKRTGATAAATVTFVIPVFGILWGTLFLQEKVTGRMILGMAVALLGTALVIKLLPFKRKRA